jgi:hypothetical protein
MHTARGAEDAGRTSHPRRGRRACGLSFIIALSAFEQTLKDITVSHYLPKRRTGYHLGAIQNQIKSSEPIIQL